VCVWVNVCVGVYPWSEWLETWLRLVLDTMLQPKDFGFKRSMVRVRVRELVTIGISRECTYLLVSQCDYMCVLLCRTSWVLSWTDLTMRFSWCKSNSFRCNLCMSFISSAEEALFLHLCVCLCAGELKKLWTIFHEMFCRCGL